MTPDDWQRIKEVAGDAWGQPAPEREAYVRTACGEDEALRLEVMNLLRCMTQADQSFDVTIDVKITGPIKPV